VKQVLSNLQKYLHQVCRSRNSYCRVLRTPQHRHRHRHIRCHLQGSYRHYRRGCVTRAWHDAFPSYVTERIIFGAVTVHTEL